MYRHFYLFITLFVAMVISSAIAVDNKNDTYTCEINVELYRKYLGMKETEEGVGKDSGKFTKQCIQPGLFLSLFILTIIF